MTDHTHYNDGADTHPSSGIMSIIVFPMASIAHFDHSWQFVH